MLVPALINGYPLVYSDTGTYLRSAFDCYVPNDRPFWYGPFVRISSLNGTSLWGVAVAQAMLCAIYVLRTVVELTDRAGLARRYLVVCVVLVATTGVGWYAGRLIPDIFTGLGILAVYHMLRGGTGRLWSCWDMLVMIAACWFHSSNLIILPLAGVVLVVLHHGDGPKRAHQAWRLLLVSTIAWGGLPLANLYMDGEAYITRNSHVFMMGRMVDTGMLAPLLEEYCERKALGICQYRGDLPDRSADFLWKEDSPLARQGGWDATREEYGELVRASFSTPRFLFWHVRGSIASTMEQLAAWRICDLLRSEWYRQPTSAPYISLALFVPHELSCFLGSLQNGGRGELNMEWPDRLYRSGLAASLVLGLWSIVARRKCELDEAHRFAVFACLAIVIGAWVCASLSVVDTRYLSRDSWMLPLAAMMLPYPWKRCVKKEASPPG